MMIEHILELGGLVEYSDLVWSYGSKMKVTRAEATKIICELLAAGKLFQCNQYIGVKTV